MTPSGSRDTPCRPWNAAGTIPFVGAFAALWWGIPVSGPAAGVAYAAFFIAYSTAYTAVVVPYGALTPTLTGDYDERTRLNAARMSWSMVGGLVAGIGLPVILGATDGSWRIAGLALAAAAVGPLLWTVVATRGRDRNEAPQQTPTAMWTVLRMPIRTATRHPHRIRVCPARVDRASADLTPSARVSRRRPTRPAPGRRTPRAASSPRHRPGRRARRR